MIRRRAREKAAANALLATRQAVMPTIGYRCIIIDPPWPIGGDHARYLRPNQRLSCTARTGR